MFVISCWNVINTITAFDEKPQACNERQLASAKNWKWKLIEETFLIYSRGLFIPRCFNWRTIDRYLYLIERRTESEKTHKISSLRIELLDCYDNVVSGDNFWFIQKVSDKHDVDINVQLTKNNLFAAKIFASERTGNFSQKSSDSLHFSVCFCCYISLRQSLMIFTFVSFLLPRHLMFSAHDNKPIFHKFPQENKKIFPIPRWIINNRLRVTTLPRKAVDVKER